MARGKSSKHLKIIIALVSGLAGVLFTWWWSEIYQQPLIKYYSQPYLKLHDEAIGHVYLWNNGRKTDRNIAVTLFTKIDPKDINIVDFIKCTPDFRQSLPVRYTEIYEHNSQATLGRL